MNNIFLLRSAAVLCLSLLLQACGSADESENESQLDNKDDQNQAAVLSFTNVTNELNINLFHANKMGNNPTMPSMFSGGVATEDYDNDGDLDFYLIGGESGTNALYQNQGDGQYIDVAVQAGVAISGEKGSGPAFADIDGDGYLDLFIGAVDYDKVYVFLNNRDGTFTDVTDTSGLRFTAANSVSASFSDFDNDGDLDLFVSHWGHSVATDESLEIVWRNDSEVSNITFADVSNDVGILAAYADQIKSEVNPEAEPDSSFVPSMADIDNDGDDDLLLVSDYGLTKLYTNIGGRFEQVESETLIDEFGMGSSLADVDNDGDLDWFVTSIAEKEYDGEDKNPTEGYRGNTLYNNDGNGHFSNVSISRGVSDGGWGWGVCFADFNNDGLTDIYHVNGWGQNGQLFSMFQDDESRLFIQQEDNTFKDEAAKTNVNDNNQGRGLSCDDYDNDGDIDIIISNNQGPATFYRNDLSEGNNYITLKLVANLPNKQAIGSKVELIFDDGHSLFKQVMFNNHFVSQSSSQLHFGLGKRTMIDSILITWPDQSTTLLEQVSVGQKLIVNQ